MNKHIVKYDKYCSTCMFSKVKDTEDPCDECLNQPVNEDSRRPVNYKEDTNAKKVKGTRFIR